MTLPVSIISKPMLDIAHHRIHEGNHFMVHKISKNINIANPKYFLVMPPPNAPTSPETIELHLIFEVISNPGGGTLEFFENPTISNNGTSLTIVNNNRRSSLTSQASVFEDPIVTSTGTFLFEEIGGTTSTGALLGEFERDEEEIILHPGDTYILKFTPLVDNTYITMELNWYDNRPSTPV